VRLRGAITCSLGTRCRGQRRENRETFLSIIGSTQERVGMLLDDRSKVNRIGRLEPMANSQIGCALASGSRDLAHVETPAFEEGVALGKKLAVGVSNGLHPALEA
jgi:hypothetical protein